MYTASPALVLNDSPTSAASRARKLVVSVSKAKRSAPSSSWAYALTSSAVHKQR